MATEVKNMSPPPHEWLNREFVQKALRSGDGDQTITVVSSEARMANAVGEGYASDMYRVTAQLGDGTTRSVIVKCHPQDGMRADMVKKWDAFSIEQRMLTKTLPAMWKLLEEARPGKYQPFAARCLYHGEEPIKFLVMEDLRQLDFTLADRQRGVDLAHCLLIAKTLARFHAASIALHARDPASIQCYDKGVYREEMDEHLAGLIKNAFRSLGKEVATWPDCKADYHNKLLQQVDSSYDRLVQVCKRRNDGYNVLTHSDPWPSNMMFRYNGEGVVDMRLLDFQTAYYTSPGIDLQYFLCMCPNEDVRKTNIDQLLHEYRIALNETLEDLGYVQHQISMEELKKEFKERQFFAVYAAIFVLPIILSDAGQFDLEEELRSNAKGLKSTQNVWSSEIYRKAMMTMLPIFDNNGVI